MSWRAWRRMTGAWLTAPDLLLTPPDTRSNTQRIYVPRQAVQTLEVLSLIGAAGRKRAETPKPSGEQRDLFGGEGETG